MSPGPRLVTIIVHFRCLEDTRRCLGSLARVSLPRHQVLVVDNASRDGSCEKLAGEFPGVEFLALEENVGYAGGNNAGFAWAWARDAPYIQVLNPDVEVLNPDYPEAMIRALERHPDWGLVGPRVRFRRRDRIQLTWHAFPRVSHILERFHGADLASRAPGSEDREGEVEAINGVCFVARAVALKQIGGFDADFFMYGEELDLCYRLRQKGWKAGRCPVESILHHPGDGRPAFSLPHNLTRAGVLRFLRKHRGLGAAAFALAWFAAGGVVKLLRPHEPGAGHYWRSLADAFLLRPARPPGSGRTSWRETA